MSIEKSNQLEVLPVWGPEFELKLDVNFQTWNSDWGNIFHLTNKSELNCCEVGTRVPAMWTKRGTKDQLTLKTAIDSDGSKIFENELGSFETGEWYSFVISQNKDEVVLLFHKFSFILLFRVKVTILMSQLMEIEKFI